MKGGKTPLFSFINLSVKVCADKNKNDASEGSAIASNDSRIGTTSENKPDSKTIDRLLSIIEKQTETIAFLKSRLTKYENKQQQKKSPVEVLQTANEHRFFSGS